ncbi:MAG: hypothetical protein NC453_28085 [Muribaculum sp.]|nr:hypothetical protein [Muribaculum sp.]
MKRCPKCNSSLVKHIVENPSQDSKTATTAGLGVAGAVIGSIFGPAGVAAGVTVGKYTARAINGIREIDYYECTSCGHTF